MSKSQQKRAGFLKASAVAAGITFLSGCATPGYDVDYPAGTPGGPAVGSQTISVDHLCDSRNPAWPHTNTYQSVHGPVCMSPEHYAEHHRGRSGGFNVTPQAQVGVDISTLCGSGRSTVGRVFRQECASILLNARKRVMRGQVEDRSRQLPNYETHP